MKTILGWTLIKNQRQLDRWERRNHISYSAGKLAAFPALVRERFCSDENLETEVVFSREIELMLRCLVRAESELGGAK